MKLVSRIALGTAGLALIAAGTLAGCADLTERGVAAPTPTIAQTIPPVLTVAAEEDDPGWDCQSQGNHICGSAFAPRAAATAWDLWDSYGGAEKLLVDTHAKVALTGYAVSDPYVKGSPVKLATNQLALKGDGIWYVFTATPNHP